MFRQLTDSNRDVFVIVMAFDVPVTPNSRNRVNSRRKKRQFRPLLSPIPSIRRYLAKRAGLQDLLLKEKEDDRVTVDQTIEQKKVKIAESQAEAQKVRQIKHAEADARTRVL